MGNPRIRRFACIVLATGIVFCQGCGKSEDSAVKQTTTEIKSETETTQNIRYNTQDLVIVKSIDAEKGQISVESITDKGKVYVLNYTSGTSIQNKYEKEVLISQIGIGEIVDVYYVSGTQKLIKIAESKEAWENDTVTKWYADFEKKLVTIGEENYEYDDNLFVISGKKVIDIENISGVDELIVRGVGNKIYSINVAKGHGYIKLTDTTNFIGGMVEVAGSIMTVITADMVIAAPEGTYNLTAWKDGNGGTVEVTVERDDEISVSLSGFNGEVKKNGAVKFNILPSGGNINVFVDNKEVDISEVVDLEYGTHQILITSDVYTDYTESFVVNSIYMNKTIDISGKENSTQDTDDDEDKEDSTQETTKADDTDEKESGQDNELTITKPEGASVYLDGTFMGTIPLTIEKPSGDHVIILRQTGYESMVYNVSFSDDENNATIYFPEMEKTGE